MATTTNYSFEKPTVGGNEDTWGTLLNGNWDSVDTLIASVEADVAAKYTATTQDASAWLAGSSTTESLVSPQKVSAVVSASISGAFTDATFNGSITEEVYTISGTSAALEPDNGSVQIHTLSGNTTYTDAFSAGQAITLMIDDGSDYTITWPTMTWVNNRGVAPDLATSGYTVVALWKVSTALYGALVGDGS